MMKIMALKQLQQANPSLYDPIAIDTAALQAMGWNNPQQFMAPPSAQQQPPPELQQAQAKIKNEGMEAQARMIEAQAKSAESQAKIQQGAFAPKSEGGLAPPQQVDTEVDKMLAQAKLMDSQTKRAEMQIKHHDHEDENKNRQLDRQSREQEGVMELVRDIITHGASAQQAQREIESAERIAGQKATVDVAKVKAAGKKAAAEPKKD
jgi:hypothetical protein